jgi:hypothetical protein
MVAIALLAPWSLALLPDAVRWAAHVTVQPLLWALAWLVCTLPVFRGGDAN